MEKLALQPSVDYLPGLRTVAAFSVAGYGRRFDQSNKKEIALLWARLRASAPFEGMADSATTYGVTRGIADADGSFGYLASLKLAPGAGAPAGMEQLDIAGGDYAVFRIVLADGPFHPQMRAAMDVIWEDLVPRHGLGIVSRPNFSAYRKDFFAPGGAGDVIEFHAPVGK